MRRARDMVTATIGAAAWVALLGGAAYLAGAAGGPEPAVDVIARVRTESGGYVMGHLVPIPRCPERQICADPLDYQNED